MSNDGAILKFPGMISIEQMMLVIDALERRIERLEALSDPEDSGRKNGKGRRTRAQQWENRTRWIEAMDAFIAGNINALQEFHEMGGWTPPEEYR